MRVLSALLSAAALLPLLTRAAFHSNDTACTRHYTVVAGDTCDKIGQKTLTSTYQILAFNLLDAGADCYTLEIGKQLCLGRYGNDCQFVHQCTNQDTCESIANAYGITTQRLQSNNPSLDCNVVYDGLMLCVSAGSIRPPADNSLNSTDVRAAREQARQMWLTQEKTKASQLKSDSHPAQSSTSSSSKHASHSKGQHHHHKHAETGAKSSHKPHSHHAAASNPSHPVADKKAPSHRQRAVEHQSPSPQTSSSSYSSDELSYIDDLLTAANHTPQDQPPLAGSLTTTTPQKRHRSLSSRSHHHRSHTP